MDAPLIIAIDGPSGVGKSTLARGLALRLAIPYVDTGAMYRAVGVLARAAGIDLDDDDGCGRLAATLAFDFLDPPPPGRLRVDGRPMEGEIRTPAAAEAASCCSRHPSVRAALVAAQRRLAADRGAVLEGRDIGTVVFPAAAVKLFVTADARERARRRWHDLQGRGITVDLDDLAQTEAARDLRDTTRAHAPLFPATDAVRIDSTHMGAAEVLNRALAEVARWRDADR